MTPIWPRFWLVCIERARRAAASSRAPERRWHRGGQPSGGAPGAQGQQPRCEDQEEGRSSGDEQQMREIPARDAVLPECRPQAHRCREQDRRTGGKLLLRQRGVPLPGRASQYDDQRERGGQGQGGQAEEHDPPRPPLGDQSGQRRPRRRRNDPAGAHQSQRTGPRLFRVRLADGRVDRHGDHAGRQSVQEAAGRQLRDGEAGARYHQGDHCQRQTCCQWSAGSRTVRPVTSQDPAQQARRYEAAGDQREQGHAVQGPSARAPRRDPAREPG